MARGEPAGQVLRGQGKEGVVHRQDACGNAPSALLGLPILSPAGLP